MSSISKVWQQIWKNRQRAKYIAIPNFTKQKSITYGYCFRRNTWKVWLCKSTCFDLLQDWRHADTKVKACVSQSREILKCFQIRPECIIVMPSHISLLLCTHRLHRVRLYYLWQCFWQTLCLRHSFSESLTQRWSCSSNYSKKTQPRNQKEPLPEQWPELYRFIVSDWQTIVNYLSEGAWNKWKEHSSFANCFRSLRFQGSVFQTAVWDISTSVLRVSCLDSFQNSATISVRWHDLWWRCTRLTLVTMLYPNILL